MSSCPCGSGHNFDKCCGPVLAGQNAASPEALMRSRYAAFATSNLDYLEHSLAPEAREDYNRSETETWIKEAVWQGLEVRSTSEEGDQGQVEFVARYKMRGQQYAHHELATFRKEEGRWVYVDGEQNPRQAQRVAEKQGRNDPCNCGSGKKFKKCCGA